MLPLLRGTRISVKDAFDSTSITNGDHSSHFLANTNLSSWIAMPIRNVFRKKKRLLINLITLTFGGIVFTAIVTTYLSLNTSLNEYMKLLNYDYQFTYLGDTNDSAFQENMSNATGIKAYEDWLSCQGILPEINTNSIYTIISPEKNSSFFTPTILQGTWFAETDALQIVISEELQEETGLKVGDKTILELGDLKNAY